MKLTESIARSIVAEISDAIDQPINLMDEKGRIVASTDASRIGTVHKGACKAIQEDLECLVVRADGEYSGSRIGVNIPIHYEGRAIGVVGITGSNYDELSRYIRLIRSTTEMLLRSRPKSGGIEKQEELWREILSEPGGLVQEELTALARRYGVDAATRYCAVAVGAAVPWEKREMAGPIRRALDRMGDRTQGCCGPEYAALFFAGKPDELLVWLAALQRELAAGECAAVVGYCREKVGLENVRESFACARTACRIAQLQGMVGPVCYEELTLELLLPALPEQTRSVYLDRVFAGQSKEVRERWETLLKVFYSCNGSVGKTAEKLFIHKNTVQYQLRKIAGLTGLDPRRLDHAAVFQMALLLDSERR